MSDVFAVSGAWDHPSYAAGQVITGVISGGATATTTQSVGPVTIPIVASDGNTSTITIPAATATVTQQVAVLIDTSKPIVDSSPTPRVWAVSADRRSITATA